MPGHYTAWRVHPGDSIIRYHKAGALLEVEPGKDDGGNGQKGKRDSP